MPIQSPCFLKNSFMAGHGRGSIVGEDVRHDKRTVPFFLRHLAFFFPDRICIILIIRQNIQFRIVLTFKNFW